MSTYPSWRYHATEPARLIHDETQEHPDWTDSPAHHGRRPYVDQKLPGDVQLSPAPPSVAPVAPEAPAPAPRRRSAKAAKSAR